MAENATDFSSEGADAPVAIVTGAAGDIGRAVAMRLHRTGFRVMACDLDVHALRSAWNAGTPGSAPARVQFMACDVAHPASVQATVAETLATWGRVDALVNN